MPDLVRLVSGQTASQGGRGGYSGQTGGHTTGQGHSACPVPRTTRFKVKNVKLKDFIYNYISSRQADQYIKTTKVNYEYVNK